MASPGKPSRFVKPTLQTKFHIDYGWWERDRDELRPYMLTHLSTEKRDYFQQHEDNRVVDYIDPVTGEVQRLDELGLALKAAAQEPDFINPQTSLVDSVFRVFLSNGNKPLTPLELAEATGRDANTILKTLGGFKVYKGIRPYHPNSTVTHASDE
jgi:hypothetical protein